METNIQKGYLVLADISGYTAYLARTELDHAHEILSDLLDLIVDRFKPLLALSKLEGDAVFAYLPETKLSRGETLLELIEATYVTFRDRVASIQKRTTCECEACRALPSLDLKFFLHYGSYIFQRVAGNLELVGPDVILIHRLMKNHLEETTGWRAYAMTTQACLEQLGVSSDDMHHHTETYEHIGDILTFNLDLHTRYRTITESRRVFVTPDEAHLVMTYDFPAPPAVVWSWVNDPRKRSLVAPDVSWSSQRRPGGRTTVGASNHCAHGKSVMVETISDWRPFDYCTVEMLDPVLGINAIQTMQFEVVPNGTRLHCHIQMRVPWFRRALFKLLLPKTYKKNWQRAAQMMVDEQTVPDIPLGAGVIPA